MNQVSSHAVAEAEARYKALVKQSQELEDQLSRVESERDTLTASLQKAKEHGKQALADAEAALETQRAETQAAKAEVVEVKAETQQKVRGIC